MAPHAHIARKTIETQMRYASSAVGFETARNIISAKVRNSRMTLTNFRESRARAESEQAALLAICAQRIKQAEYAAPQGENRAQLFRIEAQATKAYWDAVRMITRRSSEWRRRYPGFIDSLNGLLNGGYRLLLGKCLEAFLAAKLLPEIGLLHGKSSKDGLLYDFMECFRHIAVDAAVLPLFSRRRLNSILNHNEMKKAFALIESRFMKKFRYKGRCETLAHIFLREAIALRASMTKMIPWEPYIHEWGHRNQCGK